MGLNAKVASECCLFSSPEKGGGPKVGWTLDQKESIKSALFIGYVIMQVCFEKESSSKKLRNIQLRGVIMRKKHILSVDKCS